MGLEVGRWEGTDGDRPAEERIDGGGIEEREEGTVEWEVRVEGSFFFGGLRRADPGAEEVAALGADGKPNPSARGFLRGERKSRSSSELSDPTVCFVVVGGGGAERKGEEGGMARRGEEGAATSSMTLSASASW